MGEGGEGNPGFLAQNELITLLLSVLKSFAALRWKNTHYGGK